MRMSLRSVTPFDLNRILKISNVLGAVKIFNLYDSKDGNNYTVECDPDFYRFYHDSKIGHLAVLVPYVAYVLIGFFIMIPIQSKSK